MNILLKALSKLLKLIKKGSDWVSQIFKEDKEYKQSINSFFKFKKKQMRLNDEW